MKGSKLTIKNLDFSKVLFYVTLITVVLAVTFNSGLRAGAKKNKVYQFIRDIKADVRLVFREFNNSIKNNPKHFLQPSRREGSGVTVNKIGNSDGELIFLSGFFESNNEVRLIRRDGDIVAQWPVKFSEAIPDPSYLPKPPRTDWNIDLHGALALPDGSVLFNFEYGGLVKMDRCGNIVWTLPYPSHHSVELAEGGGFWVPGRNFHDTGKVSPFPPFSLPYKEDVIMKVSGDGKLITQISVPKLFYDNDLDYLLTSTGESIGPNKNWDHELVHLNKIAELKSDIAEDFPLFEAGDIMLSLRLYNMILVVAPDTQRIKWWKTGPWKQQHDPEFIEGGKIIVFNNDARSGSDALSPNIHKYSNIIEIDPVTEEVEVLYGGKPNQELYTRIRGKHEYMPHGGLLITEFEGGRILETDKNGQIIWEYVNRYSPEKIAELTEARVYPAGYFNVKDWSCGASTNS